MTQEGSSKKLQKSEVTTLANLYHEQKCRQRISAGLDDDIVELQKEIRKLELEKQWCFNLEGKRIRPTPKEESVRICQQIAEKPECKNDVVLALKKKKTWLQMEVTELEEKLKKARQKSDFDKTKQI